jgi:hypothetical protein
MKASKVNCDFCSLIGLNLRISFRAVLGAFHLAELRHTNV